INATIVFGLLLLLLSQHNWDLQSDSSLGSNDLVIDPNIELPDFSIITDVKEKKKQFFAFLRPKIKRANQKILYQKALFQKLSDELKNQSFHADTTKKKLIRLGEVYGIEKENVLQNLEELSKRIDIIPEALVLAQAANESAWGTSRFSVQANNLFGQWCFKKGCGIVPKRRNKNSTHEVKQFSSVQAAVTSYMRNLNTNRAYASLRNIRANLRLQGRPVKGVKLAEGLGKYSERGDDYIKEIVQMIKQNQLE
ncbi:MAG: glucosaminidase domain-containing protein, partial [Kangiellaceae bacterium]